MKNHLTFTRYMLIAVCLLSGNSLAAREESSPAMPAWKKLVYEGSMLGLRSRIQIEVLKSSPQELRAATPALLEDVPLQRNPQHVLVMDIQAKGSNRYLSSTRIWFDAGTGAVLQHEKTRTGKNPKRKVFRFTKEGASRIRQEPGSDREAGMPVHTWSKIKPSFYPYDLKDAGCDTVTTPSVLLYLLSLDDTGAESSPPPRCVFFDGALYRVSFEDQGSEQLTVSYRDNTNAKTVDVQGPRKVRRYRLGIAPLTPGTGKDAFELFELRGNIAIMMDSAGIPLQLDGERSLGRISAPLTSLQKWTATADDHSQR